MAVLVDDLLELLDSTFVLFDDRQEGVLKVLKQRDDGLRTCFVGVQNLRSLDPRQTVLGFSSHERKHPTVFAFPESPTFVRYSGSNELNSYVRRTHTYAACVSRSLEGRSIPQQVALHRLKGEPMPPRLSAPVSAHTGSDISADGILNSTYVESIQQSQSAVNKEPIARRSAAERDVRWARRIALSSGVIIHRNPSRSARSIHSVTIMRRPPAVESPLRSRMATSRIHS